MKSLITKYIILIALTISIISCGKNDDCIDVAYDTAFTIEAGESYCFSDDMSITIENLDNQFCPCNAVCVWEGQMEVEMTITIDGEEYDYIHYGAAVVGDSIQLPIVLDITTDDIEFSEACTESVPSPSIVSAKMTISK